MYIHSCFILSVLEYHTDVIPLLFTLNDANDMSNVCLNLFPIE